MSEKPYKHALGVIELLQSTNYANWKRSCRRILEGIRAWTIVVGEELVPNNPVGFAAAAVAERAVYIDYMNRRAQAAAIISGSCSNMVQVYLEEISNPAEMWTILAARMDTAGTVVGRMTLLRKFHSLRPTAGEPINSYFAQLLEIKNELVGSAEAISDASFMTHIFNTLPPMFAVTVEILQCRAGITIQEVLDAIRECEQNKAMVTKPDAVSEALYSQHSGKGKGGQERQKGKRWCTYCRATSHDTAYCWKKDQDGSGNKRKRETNPTARICYYCGEEGHTQKDCPVKRKADAVRGGNRGSFNQRRDGSGGNGFGGNGSGGNGSGGNGSGGNGSGGTGSGGNRSGGNNDTINGRHLIANEPSNSE
jgi:uncharacterized membrane protein YgcG